jgi:hypothetical protein
MLLIAVVCLGHKEKFTGNYQTIAELKTAVFQKYRKYFVKQNVKETSINFILTYMKNPDEERSLENLDVIKAHVGQWFQLAAKRVCLIILL